MRGIAGRNHMRITGWGPVRVDGAIARIAVLQYPDAEHQGGRRQRDERQDGLLPDGRSATPLFQGPFPDGPPPWGTLLVADSASSAHVEHTIDLVDRH